MRAKCPLAQIKHDVQVQNTQATNQVATVCLPVKTVTVEAGTVDSSLLQTV